MNRRQLERELAEANLTLLRARDKPRFVTLYGCEVAIYGSLYISFPPGTPPLAEADVIAKEPEAIRLIERERQS